MFEGASHLCVIHLFIDEINRVILEGKNSYINASYIQVRPHSPPTFEQVFDFISIYS